jgi:hypothetical protein
MVMVVSLATARGPGAPPFPIHLDAVVAGTDPAAAAGQDLTNTGLL